MKIKVLTLMLCGIIVIIATAGLLAGCGKNNNEPYRGSKIRIAAMNGPSMMGLGQLHNIVHNDSNHKYTITNAGTADVITAGLANRTIDAAAIPANTAAVIFNNGNIGLQVAAVNILNVLYLVQRNGAAEVSSLADLSGKTIHMPGQGTTPDVSFRYLLSKAGVSNVNIEFHADGTSIVAGLQQGQINYAVLAQPAATNVVMNGSSREIINLTDEWKKYNPDSDVVTGVLVVRTAFLKNNKSTFDEFLMKFNESIDFMVNAENRETAAQYVVDMGVVPNVNIARNALPKSGIVFITGQDMKILLTEFYIVLHAQSAQSIGGRLPTDKFYFL